MFPVQGWIRNLLFPAPAATPLDADHKNKQVPIVPGAGPCNLTEEIRSFQEASWLNLDGAREICGDVEVCLGEIWVLKTKELELWVT